MPAPGEPHEQEVVAARDRDLQGPTSLLLPAKVGELRDVAWRQGRVGCGFTTGRDPDRLAAPRAGRLAAFGPSDEASDIIEALRADDLDVLDQERLADVG